jgi:hypothetical protein
MPRLFRRTLVLGPVVGMVRACAPMSTTTPTAPSTLPTVLTETFTGTLLKNAAYTHPFSVTDSGSVSVFLITSADPAHPDNNAIPIGVSLGTWNGISCAIVIANDKVVPVNADNPSDGKVNGQATAAGNLCVRVYDVGFVPGSANYELLIDHP